MLQTSGNNDIVLHHTRCWSNFINCKNHNIWCGQVSTLQVKYRPRSLPSWLPFNSEYPKLIQDLTSFQRLYIEETWHPLLSKPTKKVGKETIYTPWHPPLQYPFLQPGPSHFLQQFLFQSSLPVNPQAPVTSKIYMQPVTDLKPEALIIPKGKQELIIPELKNKIIQSYIKIPFDDQIVGHGITHVGAQANTPDSSG